MAIGINANIAALRAQRQLGAVDNRLAKVFATLSSGQRINRASDDAAGLAIASSLNAKSRIYSQSIRNINDGISALNIANGSANSLSSVLTRLRELATQSASGSLSDSQRRSLDREAQGLRLEYIRIVDSTRFNNMRIMHHETGTTSIQAGTTDQAFGLSLTSSNLATGASGNGTFHSGYSVAASTPNDIVNGDFNGDGKQDIASVGEGGFLSIMLGDGNGGFATTFSEDLSDNASSLTAGDFNNDGMLDILVLTANTGYYSLLGDGTGQLSLQEQNGTSATGIESFIESADLNNDGFLDFIAVSRTDQTINISLGNGDGTFSSYADMMGMSEIHKIRLGDLNGDGNLDMVVGHNIDDSSHIYLGDGEGGFSYHSQLDKSSYEGLALVDLNGDGFLDIIGSKDGNVSVSLGNGNATFQDIREFGVGQNTSAITVGDFNGDGKLDVAANQTNGLVAILAGDGQGNLSSSPAYFSSGASAPSELLSVDLNGDGVLDLISGQGGASGSAQVMLGNFEITSYLNSFDLSTRSGALSAIDTLSLAQEKLGLALGKIGAEQSRLHSALNFISSVRENYITASARITDAEVSAESASLLRLTILRDAGAAVMAQANQQPALALLLLKQ